MRSARCYALLCTMWILTSMHTCAQAPQSPGLHDKGFWAQIQRNKYHVPDGQKVFPLAKELSVYLGSADPEMRDDLAYSILASWIANPTLFSAEELNALADDWTANLRSGIGETGKDSVFKRSFSALCLASVAERDLRTPFLGPERFHALLEQTLEYLREERDLRGFEAVKGWIHATAHTADLLAALAGNPLFTKEEQAKVLGAIAQRLATSSEIFTYGEQDRLANATAVIVGRADFDAEGFQSWLSGMDQMDNAVWRDSPPKAAALSRFENNSYFLRALVAQISQKPATPASAEVQRAVLKSLRNR